VAARGDRSSGAGILSIPRTPQEPRRVRLCGSACPSPEFRRRRVTDAGMQESLQGRCLPCRMCHIDSLWYRGARRTGCPSATAARATRAGALGFRPPGAWSRASGGASRVAGTPSALRWLGISAFGGNPLMGRCRHPLGHESVRTGRAAVDGAVTTETGSGAGCPAQAEHLLIGGVERRVGSPCRDVPPSGGLRRLVSACWGNG
jgi:hypothetical protein